MSTTPTPPSPRTKEMPDKIFVEREEPADKWGYWYETPQSEGVQVEYTRTDLVDQAIHSAVGEVERDNEALKVMHKAELAGNRTLRLKVEQYEKVKGK